MRTAASAVFQYFRRQIETNRRDILHHIPHTREALGKYEIRVELRNIPRYEYICTNRWACSALRDSISKLCSAGRPGIYSNTETEPLETAVKMTSMKR